MHAKPNTSIYSPLALLRGVWQSRELGRQIAQRNIKARYRQSILGLFWAFGEPLATTAIWVFLSYQKVITVGDTGIPYPVFVLIGTMVWRTFTDAFTMPVRQMKSFKSIISKINFPQEALISAGLIEGMFNLATRLLLIIVALPILGVWPSLSVILFPLAILCLLLLATGLGTLLLPFAMLYEDIGNGMNLFTRIWFFITPVIYPMPETGLAHTLTKFNPVSEPLSMARSWLTGGEMVISSQFVLICAISLLLCYLGLVLLKIAQPHINERTGA